jgi:hypothetical protein
MGTCFAKITPQGAARRNSTALPDELALRLRFEVSRMTTSKENLTFWRDPSYLALEQHYPTLNAVWPFVLSFAAVSGLVGMFSQQTVEKLKALAETLLAPTPKGEDYVAPKTERESGTEIKSHEEG